MRSLERHRDAGAYALGVLDEAEAFRFEDHLLECAGCTARVTEFAPAARQLSLYRRATPRFVAPVARVGGRPLDRLLSELTARRRAGRRLTLYAVAAAAVAALAGPAVAFQAQGGPSPLRITATDGRSGVWARLTTGSEPWGSRVELTVKDGAGPRDCRLVAVGRDGTEETVTGWRVPRHDARPHTVRGGASLRPGDVERYEVGTAGGEHLVTLRPGR